MEEWQAMQTMIGAHEAGLIKLMALERATEALKAGNRDEAIAPLEEATKFFEEDLRMHFRHEEQALFPVLARWIGRAGPIDAMLQEHDSLWRAIDLFGELVAEIHGAEQVDNGVVSRLDKVTKHIVWLLTSHIQQEDKMLFPLAAKTLDAAGKREVDESVETLERMYGS